MKIIEITNQDKRFYPLLGPFLSRREIVAEIGAPVLDEDGKRWFVATLERNVVGFAALKKSTKHWALVSAYVRPEFRQQGVYSELLRARVASVAADQKLQAVATAAASTALIKAGFQKTGQRGAFAVFQRR